MMPWLVLPLRTDNQERGFFVTTSHVIMIGICPQHLRMFEHQRINTRRDLHGVFQDADIFIRCLKILTQQAKDTEAQTLFMFIC